VANAYAVIGNNVMNTYKGWDTVFDVYSFGAMSLAGSTGNGWTSFVDNNRIARINSGGNYELGTYVYSTLTIQNTPIFIDFSWQLDKTTFTKAKAGVLAQGTDMSPVLFVKQKSELQDVTTQTARLGQSEATMFGNGEFIDNVTHNHRGFIAPTNPCIGCIFVDEV
jgi:hypothetical protein